MALTTTTSNTIADSFPIQTCSRRSSVSSAPSVRIVDQIEEIALPTLPKFKASQHPSTQVVVTDSNAVPATEEPADTPVTAFARWTPYLDLGALYWAFFTAGWNDGTVGVLLPRIQENYHVRSPTSIVVGSG